MRVPYSSVIFFDSSVIDGLTAFTPTTTSSNFFKIVVISVPAAIVYGSSNPPTGIVTLIS
jgi:hypothetical protein